MEGKFAGNTLNGSFPLSHGFRPVFRSVYPESNMAMEHLEVFLGRFGIINLIIPPEWLSDGK